MLQGAHPKFTPSHGTNSVSGEQLWGAVTHDVQVEDWMEGNHGTKTRPTGSGVGHGTYVFSV